MWQKMLNELKQWSIREIIFCSIMAVFAIAGIGTVGAFLEFDTIHILFSIFAVLVFLLVVKRTFLGYMLGVIALALYCYIAYYARLYNEMIISGIFLLPYLVFEMIAWFKTKDTVNEEKKPAISKILIELAIVALVTAVMLYGVYHLLLLLENNVAMIATPTVGVAGIMSYLTTYKNKIFSSSALIVYCFIGIAEWVLLAIFFNISYATIAYAFLLILVIAIRKLVYAIIDNKKAKENVTAESK